jgi:hypothetical protein
LNSIHPSFGFYVSVAVFGVLSFTPPAAPGFAISCTLRIPQHDMNETTCTQRSSKPPSIALAAGLLPTSAIQAAPADHVSEQRPIGAFRAIELSGPYHVMFRQFRR